MLGTLINIVAILIGSTIGLAAGNRLSERMRQTVMNGLGIVVLVIGLQTALQTRNILILMFSILLGGIAGEWLRLDDRLETVGRWLEERFGGTEEVADAGHSITRAFVTSSLVFCVGPLTVVGSIQDGLTGDYTLLAVKSMLDGFASLAFAATLGPGVILAALTVLVYQGGLSLIAIGFSRTLGGVSAEMPALIEMTAAGGVLVLGIGLVLLEIKHMRVANYLPALLLAPILTVVLDLLGVEI